MTANHKATHLSRLIRLLVLVALLSAALPQPAAAVTCVRNHTVVAGETVSNIAETYKVTTEELAAANNLTTPYTIFVGQILCIPGTATTTTTTGSSTSSSGKKTPSLSIFIVGNKIVIEASNYPERRTYLVRIGEKDFKYDKWVKLGRVRARKDGSIDGTFLFPKGLRNSRVIVVCLKDVANDDVSCARLRQ